MMKSIEIKNFQSHADTAIEFADGLTCLIGSSDSGKTSILRSLHWLAQNRPLGRGFIRHGSDGHVRVRLVLDDGTVIIRERGRGFNRYVVDNETLEALAGDVPPQVQDALNLGPYSYQTQLASHFLILDSPGKISATINSAAHLEAPEKVANQLAADIRELRRKGKDDAETVKALEQQVGNFAGLDEYGEMLDDANGIEKECVEGALRRDRLEDALDDMDAVELRMAELPEPPEGIGALLDEMASLAAVTEVMRDGLTRLRAVLLRLAHTAKVLKGLPDVNGMDRLVRRLEENREGYEERKAWWTGITRLVDELDATDDAIGTYAHREDEAHDEYMELVGRLGVCPVCEQRLDDDARGAVMENLK